jgi:hypothetical protein
MFFLFVDFDIMVACLLTFPQKSFTAYMTGQQTAM